MMSLDNQDLEKTFEDVYGNVHRLGEELARGGQGVVFRTDDDDVALKQPLKNGAPDRDSNMKRLVENIRFLPLPPKIKISVPLAPLKNEPGYIMKLLNGMNPFAIFNPNGEDLDKLKELTIPKWLSEIPDDNLKLTLLHYANTGSTKRRFLALSKCASILARLHSVGIIYGDISVNNCFIDTETDDVWLIDADNMRYEVGEDGLSVYTPQLGAPELVQSLDSARPQSDCWAFSVMGFMMLALAHPFIGKKVLNPEEESGGWDDEGSYEDDNSLDLDEQAYAGMLPFIDDLDDDSNSGIGGLSRPLIFTPELSNLFQKTFSDGRKCPWKRPSMAFWALEFAKAHDMSISCEGCNMTYFAEKFDQCPYCESPRCQYIKICTDNWSIIFQPGQEFYTLPHRLTNPFSFEHNGDMLYKIEVDFFSRTVLHARGTESLPPEIKFEFIEEAK
jgi:serine/threonine protein kinase